MNLWLIVCIYGGIYECIDRYLWMDILIYGGIYKFMDGYLNLWMNI